MLVKLISTPGFVKLTSSSTFNRLKFNFAIEKRCFFAENAQKGATFLRGGVL